MKSVATAALVSAMIFPVMPSKPCVTNTQPAGMKAIVQKIDATLKKRKPEVYASLNAPLTEAQISALEAKHKIVLPADLRVLYLWKNGQNLDGDYGSFFGNKTFLSLEQALEIRDELNASLFAQNREVEFETPNWWNKDWIPVFENGGGDYLCYDPVGVFTNKPGQMLDYYHNEYYRSVNAPTLQLFLEAIQRVFEKKYEDEWDSLKEIGEYPKSYRLKEEE